MNPLMLKVSFLIQIWRLCTLFSSTKASRCWLTSVNNGSVSCSNTTCHVTCHPGYFLLGSGQVPCFTEWSVRKPICVGFNLERNANGLNAGRLEVQYDGRPGYLMIYQRTMKEANVICRMLGLSNAYAYLDYRNEHVPSSKGCWYFNVRCVGNEESLLKCRNYGFTKMYTVYCSWYTTAAVMCGRPNMTVRVQNTNTLNMGRVEVSMNGTWGKVAYSSGWTVQSANVVCRMLGLPNATAAPELSMVYYKRPSGYTWIQIDGCKKNETSLFDCSFLVLGRSSYYNKHGDAGVICGPPKVSVSFAFNAALMGEVSLVVNTVRAKLGTKNWDDNSLAVLCRMAGVEGPHEVPALTLGSKVSQVEQFLWLNNVKCFGNESSLLDCENPGLRNKNKFGLASSSTAMAVCGRVNITFELTEGRTSRQGMVKPLFNGLQGVFYLQPEHNFTNLAKVICRTLGLPPPSLFVNDAKIISRYPQYRTLGIKDPRCYGNESSIGECKKTIVKDDNTGGLPGLICGKDFYCPSGCACSYALDSVHCTNANLTEVFQNVHMFTSTLHLQDNGSKTELDESFLLRLPLKVSTLSIKGYKIHRLKRAYFFRLKNKLDKLTLENNDLHILDPWFISRLKMSAIEIKDNNITTIKTDAFAGIFQCSSIYLTRNNIQFLERGAFATPYQLIIEGNNLGKITRDTLKSRHIQDENEIINRLSHEDYNCLSRIGEFLTTLSFLALPDNKIEDIEDASFGVRPSLLVLYLQKNLIRRIKKTTFGVASKRLKILWLSLNPIDVIEEGAFAGVRNLRFVSLVDTNIRIISPGKLLHMITIDPGPMRRRRAADSIVLGDTLSIQYQSSQTQSLLFECEEAEEFSSARGYLITHIGELTYCSPCPYGTFKENGTCSPCPAGGFYQDEQAQYQIVSHGLGCKQCPVGAFVSPQRSPGRQSSDCQACPDGTRRDRHALFKACSCLEDHYRIDRFKKCFPCPRGYMCTNETINLLPGFFWQWNSTEAKLTYTKFSSELQVPKRTYNKNLTTFALGIPKAYACPVSDACKGGIESECAVGYEGPLCAVCSRQFYMLASICRRCPTLPWIIAQVTLAILVLVGLFAFLFKDKKEKRDGRSISDIMTSRLKILIGFYQVTSGTISSFSYVEWPDTMVKLVRYAEIFQMNLLQIAPLHCLAESLKSDAHVKLLAIVVFNTLAILAGLVYYHIMKRRKTRQNDNNSIPGKILLQQRCYRMVFLALFITYPMTCSYIFQVLPDACHKICTSTNEKFCQFYLKSDYSVVCGGERFEAMGILSYTLLVYPVGFPSLIFFLLWKYYYRYEKGKNQNEQIQARTKIVNQNERKNLNHDGIVQGLKFIYENYASNVWFWEIIELVRKVIITSVILLAHAESRTYLGITAIISGLYAVLFAYYKPITDTFEHWLQLTSLLATMVNMIVGLLLKIPSDSLSSSVNTQVDEVFVTVLLMIANIVVIAIMVVRYMVTFLQTLNSIRKNPHCSLSCCLYLLLTVSEAGNDISGIDNNDDLKTYQDMNTGDEQPELEMTPVGLSVELKEDDENGKKPMK